MEHDLEDGSIGKICWSLPDTAFMIRAAEYGMDPVADQDAIWDMLIYEPYVDESASMHPPLVTAPTLEEARDLHLARCRAVKEEHEARGASMRKGLDSAHEEVHAALRAEVPIDMQFITLHRERTKQAVRAEQGLIKRRAEDPRTHVQVEKSRMLDAIRDQEGLHTSEKPGAIHAEMRAIEEGRIELDKGGQDATKPE